MDRHLNDAYIDECDRIDRAAKEHAVQYDCASCKDQFGEDEGGVKIEEEQFCKACHDQNKHILYYRDYCKLPICTIFNQILPSEISI